MNALKKVRNLAAIKYKIIAGAIKLFANRNKN
jgi:hypothetical protein